MLFPRRPIGTLVEEVNSWNPTRDAPGKLIKYIDLSSIDATNKSIEASAPICADNAPTRARQLVRRGDVLVSTVRPNLNGVASVPSELDGATASTGFCVLRPKPDELDSAYLFHWVKTPPFVTYLTRRATGASYPAVNDRTILESTIPLPPLDEQRRIAAILDQADDLRRKRRLALEKLHTLNEAIFRDIFGDLSSNPRGWAVIAIGNVVNVIGGFAFKSGDFADSGDGIVRISNLRDGVVDLTGLARIPTSQLGKGSKYTITGGDILMAMSGATTGKIGVVPSELSNRLYQNQRVAKFQITDNTRVTSNFLITLLQSDYYQSKLWQAASGVAQPNVSSAQLESIPIPLPPMKAQEHFSKLTSSIGVFKESQRRQLADLDTLFASLQQRAFTSHLLLAHPFTALAV